jgi:hypothetical protein
LTAGVIVLDFWASWAEPSTQQITKYAGFPTSHPEWLSNEQLKFVLVSVDKDQAALTSCLETKGWTATGTPHLCHAWSGKEAFDSPVVEAFKVNGIPTAFIIQDGVVRFRGNPALNDMEDHITKVLDGEAIVIEAA